MKLLVGLFLLIVVAMCLSLFLTALQLYREDRIKAQAIERGYASYCPLDGKWAWKGECGEDTE